MYASYRVLLCPANVRAINDPLSKTLSIATYFIVRVYTSHTEESVLLGSISAVGFVRFVYV